MDQSETFTHHGLAFVIEAAGWPSEDGANAALIDLQSWALQLSPEETAALYGALEQEREALVHEIPYDRNADPLPAVRDAQRRAVRAGLQGRSAGWLEPTVSIEAGQVSTGV
jgi:hypothetical protein